MRDRQEKAKITARTELKRALLSRSFVLGVCAVVVCLAVGASESYLPLFKSEGPVMLPYRYHEQTLLMAMASKVMLMALPILCAIPYTASFVDDYRSGYINLYLPRYGKRAYIRSKTSATALSGGLVLLLGVAVTYILFSLVFSPLEMAPLPEEAAMPGSLGAIFAKALVFFCCGCMYALLGALCASLTLNKYMAYASPFIVYYVLVILCERYFRKLYVLNPQEWLNPAHFWPGGDWGIMLIVLEFFIIILLCFRLSLNRRLKHG